MESNNRTIIKIPNDSQSPCCEIPNAIREADLTQFVVIGHKFLHGFDLLIFSVRHGKSGISNNKMLKYFYYVCWLWTAPISASSVSVIAHYQRTDHFVTHDNRKQLQVQENFIIFMKYEFIEITTIKHLRSSARQQIIFRSWRCSIPRPRPRHLCLCCCRTPLPLLLHLSSLHG